MARPPCERSSLQFNASKKMQDFLSLESTCQDYTVIRSKIYALQKRRDKGENEIPYFQDLLPQSSISVTISADDAKVSKRSVFYWPQISRRLIHQE